MRTKTNPSRSLHSGHRYLALAIAVALMSPAFAQDAPPASSQTTTQGTEEAADQFDEFTLEETAPATDPERLEELTNIHSTIEFGAGYVSDDAYRFGRYRGLEDQGAFGILNIDYLRRGPYDGDSADYLYIKADRLGLDSREATVEVGRQGDYRVRATYNEIPTIKNHDAQTIFDGVGGTRLTLPAGWVPGTSTAGMTGLTSSLHGIDLEQKRRRFGLDVAKLGSHWEFSAGFRNEDRDGLKSIGGVIGNSGGNPRAVLLPEPIDYQTREFDAAALYHNRKAQFELRYYLSVFQNDNASLTWDNPYSAINGWNASAGYPTGQGRLALPPDNQFHQISAAVGYNFSERTRISTDLALGRMSQDDRFLPYTVNPVLEASIVQPLPRTSLDGRIDTTVFNLRLTSNPTPRLHLGASYRYDDRDNQTPRDEYVYIGGDSQTQDAGTTSSRRRFNEPYSYRDRTLRLDAGYRLGGDTRLTASAEHRDTERTFSEREDARENTFTFGLNRSFGEYVETSLRLSRADRNGSTYRGNEPFLSSYSPGYTGTFADPWENAPDLRKFYQADRQRDRATLTVSVTPSEKWSLSLDASHIDEDYDASELGLTSSRIGSYTADITYTPRADLTFHGFYTRDELSFDQEGQSFTSNRSQVTDPGRSWSARHDDSVDTFGAGFNWKSGARSSFGADYIHARSDGDIDVSVGASLTAAPLPTNTTRLDSLNLYGTWRLRDRWSMRAGYWYERYRSTDWALDLPANQLANVILMAENSPDYRVHVVTVSFQYRF